MKSECNQLDAYVAGDLSVSDAERFERHLLGCDACREAIDQQEWIDSLLQSPIRLPLEPVPIDLVESARTSAFGRRQLARYVACGLAAAAVLLIAVGWWELSRQAVDVVDHGSSRGVVAENSRVQLNARPTATFVGGADVIAVPVESRHPDVTIVRIYPTYRPQKDSETVAAQTNSATNSNWYDYSNGG